MKTLRAKIKKISQHYKMGLNKKGQSVWLTITGFKPQGELNFRLNAIKGIKNGFAEYREIWVSKDEISLKHIEDGQLSIDLYSKEEFEKQKFNPKYINKRRFKIVTKNEMRYIQAPDLETAKNIAEQLGLSDYKLTQVKNLTKKEINED